jgi:hypothetical protein
LKKKSKEFSKLKKQSFLNFFSNKEYCERKIREVIKEKDEEKDSLFKEIKLKSQAPMEYLMTYGWAILIIALSLVVLYSLGIMNPKNFIPRAPPGSCFVFRPNGPGTQILFLCKEPVVICLCMLQASMDILI